MAPAREESIPEELLLLLGLLLLDEVEVEVSADCGVGMNDMAEMVWSWPRSVRTQV